MLRIVFLVLMAMMSVYGYEIDITSTTVYKSDFGIYVYGDVVSLENAFILVQAIAKSSQMTTIIALMALILLPFMAYQYFTTGSGKQLALNLSFVIPSFLFLNTTSGIPTATMHIEDLRTETNYTGDLGKTYAKIDGIPYPIALITSSISTVTDSLMRLYEDAVALTNPNIAGFSTTSVGFGTGIGDMLKILTSANLDINNDKATSLFARSLTAYTEQCGLKLALANDPDLVINFKNPKEDLFKAIDPITLGITGNAYTLTFTSDPLGEQTYQCDTFWANNIIAKYGLIADKLRDNINKVTVGNINNSSVITSAISMGSDINDSVVSSEIGKFNAYILNLAARAPISKAFANSAMNISSGQDLANSMTAGLAMGEMQMEGVGKMKWMAEVIPYGFHFMLGVIYSISILIMMVATALGAQKGFMIWKNFTKGLMTFEFIKVSLVIINASVNQYGANHAADFLASIGQNPATITSLPYYYHYLANMAGVAGVLGVAAIFLIPAMVFSGEVSMAAGAIGSLAGKYKGNDSRTATDTSAEQQSKNDAWERELRDQARLDKMGVTVPTGMGASDYYAKYKQGAEQANVGWGAYNSGTEAMADAGVGTKRRTTEGISSMSMYGSNITDSQAKSAGSLAGSRDAGKMQGDSQVFDTFGGGNIMNAAKLGSLRDGSAMNKFGGIVSDGDAIGAGNLQGLTNAGSTIGQSRAMGNMEKDGSTNKYMHGLSLSEEAKVAGIKGLGSLNSGDQAKYITASENQGMMKAQQTIGDTEGSMSKYNEEAKRAGKELADVIKDVANTVAQAKTGSTIGGINAVGSDRYIANQETKAMSDSKSLDTSIETAGGRAGFVATNARKAGADMGALRSTMSTADKEYGSYEAFMSDSAGLTTGQKAGATKEQLKNLTSSMMEKLHSDMLGATDANGNKLIKDSSSLDDMKNADGTFKSGIGAAAWFAAKESGNKEGMHGLAVDGNKVGVQLGAGGARITEMSSTNRINTGTSKSDDTSTNINSQTTEKMGGIFEHAKSAEEKVVAFNMHQKAHGGKQISYNNDTNKAEFPDEETAKEFMKMTGKESLTKETRNNITNQTLAEIADYLGVSETGIVGGIGGAVVGLGGLALGKQLGLSGNKSIIDKTNSKTGNTKTDNVDSQHGNSFSNDIHNYTEEYGVSKEKFNKEAHNLEGLEAQRANLKDGDTRASRLDNQIAESKKSMAEHQHDMDIADRNIKATKHLSTKEPHGHTSHMQSAGKGLFGMLALSATGAIIDEANPDQNGLAGGTLGAVQSAANFSDSILGGAGDILGGAVKGGMRVFTGGDVKGAVFGGLSQAASRVTASMNEDLGVRASTSGSNANVVEGYDIGGSSNQSSANTEQTQQFEQIKTEMSQNATSANAKTAQINNQVGNTRMMIEDLGDSIQEDFAKKLDEMGDKMESINKKLTK